ncbi:MAG: hypothetical protein AAF790_15560, partial [Planctomycetota bacterium]
MLLVLAVPALADAERDADRERERERATSSANNGQLPTFQQPTGKSPFRTSPPAGYDVDSNMPAPTTIGHWQQGGDLCPMKTSWWKRNTDEWPVDTLSFGGETYNSADLMAFLNYRGNSTGSKIAKELTATLLNIANGSPAEIVQDAIDAANAFLNDHPPGTRPSNRQDRRYGNDIRKALKHFNKNGPCVDPPPAGPIGVDESLCTTAALSDSAVHGGNGNHALWLPGIGTDFVFEPIGAFDQNLDGTATLVGTAISASNPNRGFAVSVQLAGYTTDAPAGSPKRELRSSAYVENGGPVDPSTWAYYTDVTGTLTGLGELDGAVISLNRTGPAWQQGVGANGKNANPGASTWFLWTVDQQPANGAHLGDGQGDFNL